MALGVKLWYFDLSIIFNELAIVEKTIFDQTFFPPGVIIIKKIYSYGFFLRLYYNMIM